ncbi:hypothetical protein, partial [Helicobacter pylori]|uniref:hypothetical protein n=1 Tax=Helicobacter pylori TaxID=210 RepID=UPI001EE85044
MKKTSFISYKSFLSQTLILELSFQMYPPPPFGGGGGFSFTLPRPHAKRGKLFSPSSLKKKKKKNKTSTTKQQTPNKRKTTHKTTKRQRKP